MKRKRITSLARQSLYSLNLELDKKKNLRVSFDWIICIFFMLSFGFRWMWTSAAHTKVKMIKCFFSTGRLNNRACFSLTHPRKLSVRSSFIRKLINASAQYLGITGIKQRPVLLLLKAHMLKFFNIYISAYDHAYSCWKLIHYCVVTHCDLFSFFRRKKKEIYLRH